MHRQEVARTAQRVTLRLDTFRAFAAARGHGTPSAIADAMNVHRSTVTRVLAGQQAVGADFIAGALTALAPVDFRDLFDITPTA